MRLASYNVEWFDSLFDNKGRPLIDDEPGGRHRITRGDQLEALGHVFRRIDADAIMVIEAPDTNRRRSTTRALANFAEAAGLRTRDVVTGFANNTQQEIALLYDADKLRVRHDPRDDEAAPRFDMEFGIDLDIDARADIVNFSKPPLELAVETLSGRKLRMIGAHLKSKAPHGAKGRDAIMKLAIANRRKQLAQAVWLRRRIVAHLHAGEDLILMGDLNDGPGLDSYEGLFGRSSVEILLGNGDDAEMLLYDPHAAEALQRRIGAQPTTARFYIHSEKRYLQALLDYVMISSRLRDCAPSWRIWHPFDDAECWQDEALRGALLVASDHFPVTLDVDL
ncbi:endonuclease/exonuclease/phosphatase family protein [Mameliella sediminis]|uniref:endonuclease/exonuclease/phosphatase family protein n=1 Tax=Mameliella sediminis TaxID=2836866 RepID=UPI001C4444B1|nr:endonuclease [Mameliella sediminis]MBY6162245.1 endonuclease [Mameliella alba]MBY6170714.1 endonuclease [Mameliella alba]MBY6175732.1 endonuclease [Mameliella alba]